MYYPENHESHHGRSQLDQRFSPERQAPARFQQSPPNSVEKYETSPLVTQAPVHSTSPSTYTSPVPTIRTTQEQVVVSGYPSTVGSNLKYETEPVVSSETIKPANHQTYTTLETVTLSQSQVGPYAQYIATENFPAPPANYNYTKPGEIFVSYPVSSQAVSRPSEEHANLYIKNDPTLTSSSILPGRQLHYDQPGSPGGQMTLYSGNAAFQYWQAGSTSPPVEYVQGYPNIAAIANSDPGNIQLYQSGGYSVGPNANGTQPSWTAISSLVNPDDAMEGAVMTVDSKECMGCTGNRAAPYLCQSCIMYNKFGAGNRAPLRCSKPRQTVSAVRIFKVIFFKEV